MDRSIFVRYHSELQVIADFLNHKLYEHPDYLNGSFIFICGMKEEKLIIDVVDIDPSFTRQEKKSVLELMSSIANDNNQEIENAYKRIISSKSFPRPVSSQPTI